MTDVGDNVRCLYCGTTLDEKKMHCAATGTRHYVSVCRKYVYQALQTSKTECARLRKVADAAAETTKRLDAMSYRIEIYSADYDWLTNPIREALAALPKEKTDD